MRKKRRDTVARTTISLPQHLRARMLKRPETNWSQVAARAFERELEQFGLGKPDPDVRLVELIEEQNVILRRIESALGAKP